MALSLLAVGVCLWMRRAPSVVVGATMAVAAGLIHGHAYGEAVIGAQAMPIAWYMVGLAIVQSMLRAHGASIKLVQGEQNVTFELQFSSEPLPIQRSPA